jgi:glycosyltransferase involved in cell wall biosynthesis
MVARSASNSWSLTSGRVATGHIKPPKPTSLNVGVAIPARNEERNIKHVLSQLKQTGFGNILVIDGLSTDDTLEVAEENGAKIVMQDGRGKGQAIRQVLNNDYLSSDALVLMDADGSMSASEVPRFVEALVNGADVAKGSRFIEGGGTEDMTGFRKIGNTLMTKAVNIIWSTNYTDLCYGFVAFNKKAIRTLAPLLESNNFEIETEIFIKARKLGLKVVEIPSIEYPRINGKSSLHSLRDGFKICKTIFNATMS